MIGYFIELSSMGSTICFVSIGMWLFIILLIILPLYIIALIMAEYKKRRPSSPKNEKHKNDKELTSLEDVSKYFDIDITETDTHFLVGVKRRSDGEEMWDSFDYGGDMWFQRGIGGTFPHYMERLYGFEVGFEDHKYTLKKDTYEKSSPDEKDPDTNDVRFWIEMFIFENRRWFRYSDWKPHERGTEN